MTGVGTTPPRFDGFTADSPALLALAVQSLEIAASLQAMAEANPTLQLKAAAQFASAAAAGLLAMSGTPCPFGYPPVDIEHGFDSSRRIILQCSHHPRHRWLLDGTPLDP